jgi:hypothetical protein
VQAGSLEEVTYLEDKTVDTPKFRPADTCTAKFTFLILAISLIQSRWGSMKAVTPSGTAFRSFDFTI